MFSRKEVNNIGSFFMAMKITPITLKHPKFTVQGFSFIPKSPVDGLLAIGSHGYTSSKSSIVSWATRLANENCPVVIFDLPGHFLGSFEEVEAFDDFSNYAHELFQVAVDYAQIDVKKLILMGHSLGAFLSLKSLTETNMASYNTINICVGLGIHQQGKPHLMETSLYKPTLDIRRQLVSQSIPPEKIFQWLRDQKDVIKISERNIAIINGEDDAVVGVDGNQRLVEHLKQLGNHIISETPKSLAHHKPDLAAAHIASVLKKRFKVF